MYAVAMAVPPAPIVRMKSLRLILLSSMALGLKLFCVLRVLQHGLPDMGRLDTGFRTLRIRCTCFHPLTESLVTCCHQGLQEPS